MQPVLQAVISFLSLYQVQWPLARHPVAVLQIKQMMGRLFSVASFLWLKHCI